MIQEYLGYAESLVGLPPNSLRFFRQQSEAPIWVEVNDQNFDRYCKPDYGYSARLLRYVVKQSGGTVVTSFGLYEFPSCCAFCVSTGANVHENFRGKGLNILTNQLRQDIAKHFGYSALLCTDVDNNVPERKTLARNGFKDIYQILNKRTGNVVNISVKELK